MEKRALLAFVLSLLVLFGYQYLFLSKPQEQQSADSQAETQRTEQPEMQEAPAVIPGNKRGDAPPPLQESRADNIAVPEEWVWVETSLAKYKISTRDAFIKEIELKNYKDDTGAPIRLVEPEGRYYPLEMIFDAQERRRGFTPSEKDMRLSESRESGTLELLYRSPTGAAIKKSLTFKRSSYEIKIQIHQDIQESYHLVVGSHFQRSGEKEKSQYRSHSGPVLNLDGKIERIKHKDIEETKSFSGAIPWIAYERKYFMMALAPETPEGPQAEAVLHRVGGNDGSQEVFGLRVEGKDGSSLFYAGPKDYELLKSQGIGLEEVINFGFFSVLAKPIFYILKLTYKFFGSYGVAIIFLTSLIKLLFWPLTHKQQNSMKGMQKIQPEMNAIREKFKNDPQRMNREVMTLYKKHKVNPAAGCLPLVIQIPVFFALYNVLLNAIELRGAPFLYIPDLSAADSLFGHVAGFAVGPLPLLMGVSMYYQQKLMPSGMDPKQAKLFQLMPVVFTFMFLNFPSGLVLYWLVNNVLTIVQQYFINKKHGEIPA